MKYRKKPVIVDAVQWAGARDTNRILNWLAQMGANITGWEFHDTDITIPTLEGDHKALPGDFIIRGTAGEFYPCKPEIFANIYEEVEPNDPILMTIRSGPLAGSVVARIGP
jgi:hypothetical protein